MNLKELLAVKSGEMGRPISAAFEISPICNLSCKMCYVRMSPDQVRRHGGLIKTEQWLEWIEAADQLGVLFPLITGGEPLLHPDFKTIYLEMYTRGMQIAVNTNGTLLNEEWIDFFKKYRPVRLNITIYGASEEAYGKLCGNTNSWGKVEEAVRMLKEADIPVKLNSTLTVYNQSDIPDMAMFARKNRAPLDTATYLFPPYRRNEESANQEMLMNSNGSYLKSAPEIAEVMKGTGRPDPKTAARNRLFADLYQYEPKYILGQAKRFSAMIPVGHRQLKSESVDKTDLTMTCRGGYSSLWITWKGEVENCGMLGTKTVSLQGRTLQEAWEILRAETREFRYSSECSRCPNLQICHPCQAMIRSEKSFDESFPYYLCEYNYYSSMYYAYAAQILDEEGLLDYLPECHESYSHEDQFE